MHKDIPPRLLVFEHLPGLFVAFGKTELFVSGFCIGAFCREDRLCFRYVLDGNEDLNRQIYEPSPALFCLNDRAQGLGKMQTPVTAGKAVVQANPLPCQLRFGTPCRLIPCDLRAL